jgi:hypothetical protein
LLNGRDGSAIAVVLNPTVSALKDKLLLARAIVLPFRLDGQVQRAIAVLFCLDSRVQRAITLPFYSNGRVERTIVLLFCLND